MEKCFVLVCKEHNCRALELSPRSLFGQPGNSPNFLVMERDGSQEQVSAHEKKAGCLMLIEHSNCSVLGSAPDFRTLEMVSHLNQQLRLFQFLLSAGEKSWKLALVAYVFAERVEEQSLKHVIWQTMVRMHSEWERFELDVLAIVKRTEFHPVSPQCVKEIVIDTMKKIGFPKGKEKARAGNVTLSYGTTNFGETMSVDARDFPFCYIFFDNRIELQFVFCRNRKPYCIDKRTEDAFYTLALQLNSRVVLGDFRVKVYDGVPEKHFIFSHTFLFSKQKAEDVRTILPELFSCTAKLFKIYSQAANQLAKAIAANQTEFDFLEYIRFSESIRPTYINPLTQTVAVTTRYGPIQLGGREFMEESRLLVEIRKDIELQGVFLCDAVTLNSETLTASAIVSQFEPLSQFLRSCEDLDQYSLSLELIGVYQKLARKRHCTWNLEEVLFVRMTEEMQYEVKLLPWNLRTLHSEQAPFLLEEVLTRIFAQAASNPLSTSIKESMLLIESQDVETSDRGFSYLCRDVNLVSLQAPQPRMGKMTICLQGLAPLLSHLQSFSHMLGLVEIGNRDLGELAFGWYRVDEVVDRLFTNSISELRLEGRFNIAKKIIEAIISLHAFGYTHFCICPEVFGKMDDKVVFLQAAFAVSMLWGENFKEVDARFLAPEVIAELRGEGQRAGRAADSFSAAMLVYHLLVNREIYDVKMSSSISPINPASPLPINSTSLDFLYRLHQNDIRPLFPINFEDKFPALTLTLRLCLEDASTRPSLADLLEALETEAPIDIDSLFDERY